MRRWTIAYTVIAIGTFGWLAGQFGVLPSLIVAFIFFIPAAFAWRMLSRDRTIKRREIVYLGIVTIVACCGTAFVVAKWYDTGMDRLTMFEREVHHFRNRVASMCEYQNVEVLQTNFKGGRVYLRGHVTNKDAHDRLIQMLQQMVRNADSGYLDEVKYPGKANTNEMGVVTQDGDEQPDAPDRTK